MGVRFPSLASQAISNALPATNVETPICTLPPFNISLDNSQIFLGWRVSMLVGTGTTILTFLVRRGTGITGTTLTTQTQGFTTVAGNFVVISGWEIDTPGAVAGQQYVLTCSQTGATGAGTLRDVALLAFAL